MIFVVSSLIFYEVFHLCLLLMTESMTLKLELKLCTIVLKWHVGDITFMQSCRRRREENIDSPLVTTQQILLKNKQKSNSCWRSILLDPGYCFPSSPLKKNSHAAKFLCASAYIFVSNHVDHYSIIQTDGAKMHTVHYTVFALDRAQNIYKGYFSLTSPLSSHLPSLLFLLCTLNLDC